MIEINQVHKFCDNIGKKKTPKKKKLVKRIVMVLLLTFFLIGSVFNAETILDVINSFTDEEPVIALGDSPIDVEPFIYWYAPSNSFGISSTKTVNWSYFRELFNSHTDWLLEYKRYSYSDWTDGNQYLSIDKDWQEEGFWKINLTFTAPVDVFEARFTFACDLVVLDYVERDGYEVWLNYTVGEGDVYNLMFNWSDLKQYSGMYFNKGIQDNRFWFRFGKQNIPAGVYVFDPTFGHTTASAYYQPSASQVLGVDGTTGNAGTADNITVNINADAIESITCKGALYNSSVCGSSGTPLAMTEERTIANNGGMSEEVFDFTGTVNLLATTEYYVTLLVKTVTNTPDVHYSVSGVNTRLYDVGITYSTGSLPSVLCDETGDMYIYCSYTEGVAENSVPTSSNEAPTNNTYINWNGNVRTYSVVSDTDGDTINVSWWHNSSGTWGQYGVGNTSVSSGTNISQVNANFSVDDTHYYWWIIGNDGEGGEFNNSFKFIVNANVSGPVAKDTPPFTNISSENPTNNSFNNSRNLLWNVTIHDNDSTMNYTLQSSNGDSHADNNTGNGSVSFGLGGLTHFTQYTVWVNLTDYNSPSNITRYIYYFTTVNDTVTVTLIDYMPSNLRTNNTGEAWFLYNITTNATPINFWSIVWAYGVNHTITGTHNTSYSLEDHLAQDKLRGINRNVNETIELKFNTTAGDGSIGGFGEWNTHDGNKNITLVDSGSNWTLVNATEVIAEHLFSSISFVDYEELAIEDKTSQTLEISKTNFIKIEFNMTDTGWYNDEHYKNTSMFFHLYANQTNANKPLDIFYANSNYTTGSIITSPYTELIGDIHQDDTYHFNEYNSSYYEIDFNINETGFIGSVDATSKFYMILCSQAPSAKKWYLHYADDNISHSLAGNTHYHDFDNHTIMTISDDGASSWTANNSTPDVYFNYISLDEEDKSEVKLYANDTSGNSAWSSVHVDLIDITNYAPDPANIIVPNVNTNYTVGDTIPINYRWIGDPNLDICWVNITLWDWETTTQQDWIINQSITDNDRTANNSNFTYNWDTTGTAVSNYTIAINITDNSLWNNHSSAIFYINASPPAFVNNQSNASFPNPTNHSTGISPQPICNATITDQDGNTSTCDFYTSTDNVTYTWVQTNTTVINESIQFNYTTATGFNTKYYWNITVNDGLDNVSFFFDFTTHVGPPPIAKDTPPVLSNPNPGNSSTGQNINLIWNITIYDADSTFNYTIQTSNGDSSADNNTANGSKTIGLGDLSYLTLYTVWVNATDTANTSNITRAWYQFTTGSEITITISNIYPSNNSNNIELQPYIYAQFNSSDGNLLNITWYYNGSSLATEINSTNGTYNELLYEATNRSTSYTWTVKINDGSSNWLNHSYSFTTASLGGGSGSTGNSLAVAGLAIGIITYILVLFVVFVKKKNNRR